MTFQQLLDRVPHGESLVESLTVSYRGSDLTSIDETIQLCVTRELRAIDEQVSNVKAGLRTWLHHLDKVSAIKNDFDARFGKVEGSLKNVESFVDSASELGAKNIKQLLEEFAVS